MLIPIIINPAVVLDSWSTVIEDAQGMEPQIYSAMVEVISESDVRLKIKFQKFAPGWLAAILGDRRGCMTIRNEIDADLQTFAVHITANTFGTALVVNYFLTTRLGFFRALVEKAGHWLDNQKPPVPLTAELNVVQREILMTGFTTTVFTALQRAIEEVMQELGQDAGTVESRTGFIL